MTKFITFHRPDGTETYIDVHDIQQVDYAHVSEGRTKEAKSFISHGTFLQTQLKETPAEVLALIEKHRTHEKD